MRYCTHLVHPDVRVNGSGVEGDLHMGLLVGDKEARGREGSKVWAQGSHIQCIFGAYISVVLHLEPLLCLHQSTLVFAKSAFPQTPCTSCVLCIP